MKGILADANATGQIEALVHQMQTGTWAGLWVGLGLVLKRLPDHITVEFPSEKLHVTSYDSDGRKLSVPRGAWRSAPSQNPDLRLLFAYFVRMDIVREQDVLVTRKFRTPRNDEDRRKLEFARCADFGPYELSGPLNPSGADFAYIGIFRSIQPLTAESLPNSLMPKSADLFEDWPEDMQFPLVVGQLALRGLHLCLVAGFPPGKLQYDVCFGFPQRIPSNTKNEI